MAWSLRSTDGPWDDDGVEVVDEVDCEGRGEEGWPEETGLGYIFPDIAAAAGDGV
jgi:hypothetical protein